MDGLKGLPSLNVATRQSRATQPTSKVHVKMHEPWCSCLVQGTCGVAAILLCAANGAELGRSGSSPVLQYRRQLVPESEVELRVQQGYMAMRRERFDQMLAEINGQSADPSGGPVVHIQRAVYTARWENGQLVDGQAELDIRHSGSAPVPLSFSPLGVAIVRPEWTDDAKRTAILGLDSSGNAVLIVDRSATLVFNWSLQALPESSEPNVFRLQFPPATLNELRLALPPDVLPVVDQGFVEPFERPPGEDSERRTWLLQLRGERPTELQIVPREAAAERRQLVMMRQASRYGFTNAGLDYKTTFSLDVHYAPLRELAIEVDPELRVLAARLGDVDVPVRLSHAVAVAAERTAGTPPASEPPGPEGPAAAPPQPAAPLRWMLRFPEPVQGIGQELGHHRLRTSCGGCSVAAARRSAGGCDLAARHSLTGRSPGSVAEEARC